MKREETRELGFIVYIVWGRKIEITTLLSMKIIDFVIKDFFFIKKLRIFLDHFPNNHFIKKFNIVMFVCVCIYIYVLKKLCLYLNGLNQSFQCAQGP